MISASTDSEVQLRRMRETASRLAAAHGERLVAARETARINWRSARTLWPDLGWD